jgi:two-component system, chemotaxis family, chemotaxis protein CheY
MSAKKILIIDDDASVRFTLKRILTDAGYEVIDAVDGKKGMQRFDVDVPDLVITDLIMPEQEGIETIIALKSARRVAPVVAISGGGRIDNKDLLHMAERLGADAVLHKPFGAAELIKIVKEKLAA